MKKRASKKITLAVLSILLLASALTLADEDTNPASAYSQLNEISNMPIKGSLLSEQGSLWTVIVGALYRNPTIFCVPGATDCATTGGVNEVTTRLIQIMIPFYVIAVLFCAIFFIMKSGSPRGRARARSMFLKLLFGMVIVTLSPALFQLLLDFEYLLLLWILPPTTFSGSTAVIPAEIDLWIVQLPIPSSPFADVSLDDMNPGTFLGVIGGGCVISCCTFGVYVVGGLLAWARNILVFFYGVFFPLIAFFYFFDLTKPYGRKWMQDALKWIFLPVLQALIIVFTVTVKHSLEGSQLWSTSTWINLGLSMINPIMATATILAGMVGFIAAPLVVGQLMGWVGNTMVAIGLSTRRTWLVAAGGVLAGGWRGGPNQIAWAHAEYSRGIAYSRSEAAISEAVGGRAYSVRPSAGRGGAVSGRGGAGGMIPPGETSGVGPARRGTSTRGSFSYYDQEGRRSGGEREERAPRGERYASEGRPGEGGGMEEGGAGVPGRRGRGSVGAGGRTAVSGGGAVEGEEGEAGVPVDGTYGFPTLGGQIQDASESAYASKKAAPRGAVPGRSVEGEGENLPFDEEMQKARAGGAGEGGRRKKPKGRERTVRSEEIKSVTQKAEKSPEEEKAGAPEGGGYPTLGEELEKVVHRKTPERKPSGYVPGREGVEEEPVSYQDEIAANLEKARLDKLAGAETQRQREEAESIEKAGVEGARAREDEGRIQAGRWDEARVRAAREKAAREKEASERKQEQDKKTANEEEQVKKE